MRRPKKERASLIALFALGLLVCIFAGLRLKALWKTFGGDPSWYGYELWLWVSLEVHIGIIIASLPGIRLLFIIIFGKVPLFHASEVESTLLSDRNVKATARPASNGRKYFNDNVTITTISALEIGPKVADSSNNNGRDHPSHPKVLQRLRLMSPKSSPFENHRLSTGNSDFDFDTELSLKRPKSASLSTIGTGDGFEEIAVPPPTFGGLLVYKNTEIHVTTESREDSGAVPRVKDLPPVIPHDVLASASSWDHLPDRQVP
ncbi:hypothetical protein DRE_00453 [Drechslerella stenobrocha 248]|uniref:Rhodopsin domain-containing protein n=1 Tax=Drechslerella stenobrocha 248 TaxID=1043628 RepID=W7IER9_9PEZI|nr:hypothetical protein DRE_00453 [Drechslerella stenobrocha 248]